MSIGVRELARQIGRNPSTITRWTRRGDWQWGPPPWPPAEVPAITRWAANLSPDQAEELHGGERGMLTPGTWRVRPDQVKSEPLFAEPLRRHFGAKNFAAMNGEDLEVIAEILSFGISAAMKATAEARGEAFKLQAPAQYFDELMRATTCEALQETWNALFTMPRQKLADLLSGKGGEKP